MSEILAKQKVTVETDCDRIILTVGRTQIPMPYAATFRIAAHLKMVCKQAMRISFESLDNWDERLDFDRDVKINELNPHARTTNLLQNFSWRIDMQGEMVYLVLGNNELPFHFEGGLHLSQWLRCAAAQAKKWAGDSGSSMHCVGTLTDAEDNYKHGYQ